MKIVVAGLGSIGRRHLRNLRLLGEHDIVLLRSHRSTIPDDELLADLPVETTIEAALDYAPQALVVANPTSLHLPVAIPAAQAGCHILMEKPISDSLDGIVDLKNALILGGGNLLVGFQYRFHPSLGQVKTWLTGGEIGKVISFHCEWGDYLPDWHPWEDYRLGYAARKDLGGGVVRTLCHPLDYLRWMLGEAAVRSAFVGKLSDLDLDVEDHADVQLKFGSNVEGTLHLDYYRKPGTHRLEVFGTKGMIEWKNETGAARIFRQETDAWETFLPEKDFERNTLFINEMRHFLTVARGEAQPTCTLDDGLRAQELVEEILKYG